VHRIALNPPQRALSEERVEALLVDRKVRQQEEERHRANFLVQVRREGKGWEGAERAPAAAHGWLC
jgi:hypothetical protein